MSKIHRTFDDFFATAGLPDSTPWDLAEACRGKATRGWRWGAFKQLMGMLQEAGAEGAGGGKRRRR